MAGLVPDSPENKYNTINTDSFESRAPRTILAMMHTNIGITMSNKKPFHAIYLTFSPDTRDKIVDTVFSKNGEVRTCNSPQCLLTNVKRNKKQAAFEHFCSVHLKGAFPPYICACGQTFAQPASASRHFNRARGLKDDEQREGTLKDHPAFKPARKVDSDKFTNAFDMWMLFNDLVEVPIDASNTSTGTTVSQLGCAPTIMPQFGAAPASGIDVAPNGPGYSYSQEWNQPEAITELLSVLFSSIQVVPPVDVLGDTGISKLRELILLGHEIFIPKITLHTQPQPL